MNSHLRLKVHVTQVHNNFVYTCMNEAGLEKDGPNRTGENARL